MRNMLTTALAMALLSTSLAGCGNGGGDGSTGGADSAEVNDALTEKLQPFITCLNDVDSELQDDAQSYRDHLQYLATKQGSGLIFDRFHLEDGNSDGIAARKCITDLRAAVEQSPADAELDKLGRDYAAALEKLLPLAETVDHYYDQKDYLDDGMAKGKTLDAQIAPLLTNLGELSTKLHKTIEGHQAKIAEAELVKIEKAEGKGFSWHTEKVMLEARRSVDKIDAAISEEGKVDLPRVKEAEAQIQQAYDAATAYAKAHPDEKAANGSRPMWFVLQDYTERYLQEVKTLRRDAEAGKADELERNLQNVVREFNTLVNNYNNQAEAQ